tara:strand:+ start:1820 stop:2452 length:633 start_codon:yes stop_codon:yes gene_type:complete
MANFFSKLKVRLYQNLKTDKVFFSSFEKNYDLNSCTVLNKHTKAAVLCLLEVHEKNLNIILTLRSRNLKDHPGQISLPGGKVSDMESFSECALRETYEEIGLKSTNISILGELNYYLSGSNFLIKPIVGIINGAYKISLNKYEVEKVIPFPIKYLFNKKNLTKSFYTDKRNNKKMYYYDINWNDERIWGTTAIILVHLSKLINSGTFKNV